MADVDRRAWRLLPSEHVLWHGAPTPGVPRDLRWTIVPALFVATSVITALLGGLLIVAEIHAVQSTGFVSLFMLLTGVAIWVAPRFLLDPCEYLVTDRQVIWKRGPLRRTIDRRGITFARVHWHRSMPGVGHLELVRAVPFGPLARRQRILLHDVRGPDGLFATIREVEPAEFAGFADVQLTDRLDPGETVLWGSGPQGYLLGRGELVTAALGGLVLMVGLFYGYRTGGVLVALESVGLPVRSWTWLMLFGVMLITATVILSIGAVLLWKGTWGARADGSRTEYILTDTRLLIRRGLTELSIDRRRIVDVAALPSSAGSSNLHLILDAPNARALEDSGALSVFSVPRALVPPVLYEVRDLERLRRLLLDRHSDPGPPLDHAA